MPASEPFLRLGGRFGKFPGRGSLSLVLERGGSMGVLRPGNWSVRAVFFHTFLRREGLRVDSDLVAPGGLNPWAGAGALPKSETLRSRRPRKAGALAPPSGRNFCSGLRDQGGKKLRAKGAEVIDGAPAPSMNLAPSGDHLSPQGRLGISEF